MRRIALWSSLVFLSVGGALACGAFGGSDATAPVSDSGLTDAGGVSDPTLDGAVTGSDDGSPSANKDAGDASTCTNVVFELPNCSAVLDAGVDGGPLGTDVRHSGTSAGPSCSFAPPAGNAVFTETFNTMVGDKTTLEFQIFPVSTDLDVAMYGCLLGAHVGSELVEMSLSTAVGTGQKLTIHIMNTATDVANPYYGVPVIMPNLWNQVTLEILGAANTCNLTVANSTTNMTTFSPLATPDKGVGAITLTCGVTGAAVPATVLIDSIKLSTTRCP